MDCVHHGATAGKSSFPSGSGGSGADELVKVSVADTTADYLFNKIAAAGTLSKSIINAGGNELLQLNSTDFLVKVSAADMSTSYLNSKITAGAGITKTILNPGAFEQLEISAAGVVTAIPGQGIYGTTLLTGNTEFNNVLEFRDDFYDSGVKPFWYQTGFAYSPDWIIDILTNGRINGFTETADYTVFREGIEGNLDYSAQFNRVSATSCGFRLLNIDETSQVRIIQTATKITVSVTGDVDEDFTGAPYTTSPIFLRVLRRVDTYYFYYRLAEDVAWTLLTTKTIDLGYRVKAAFDTAAGSWIKTVRFTDNVMPDRIVSTAQLEIDRGNVSGTVAIDAATGNMVTMTATTNITIGNPTNPIRGQKIIFRVKQDGTGSRLVSWDTKYRFSSDLPAPVASTTPGKIDYFGFVYNLIDDKWDYIAEVKGF